MSGAGKDDNRLSYGEFYERIKDCGRPELLEPLKELAGLVQRLQQRDRRGNFLPMEEKDREDLKRLCDQTARACDSLLNNLPSDVLSEHLLGSLGAQVTKELGALENIRPGRDGKLPSYYDMGRFDSRIVVDISGARLGSVGGAMSSRIPMVVTDENGVERKGFFTKDSRMEPQRYLREAMQRVGKEHPELKEIADAIASVPYKNVEDALPQEKLEALSQERTGRLFSEWEQNFKKMGLSTELIKKLPQNEPGLTAAFSSLALRLKRCSSQIDINKNAGIRKEAVIARRNSAMSAMATCLGNPGLLAKTINMSITNQREVNTGVFMSSAEGFTETELVPENPRFDGAEIDFETSELKESMADLRVLDYICGNLDRHAGNFTYIIEKGEDGRERAVGVQGLDNDLSFGTDYQNAMFMAELDEIGVVSRSMADRVKNLSHGRIQAVLEGQGLGRKEVQASWERLRKLQEKIADGKIRIVEKEEWKQLSMEQLEAMCHQERPGFGAGFSMIVKAKNEYKRCRQIYKGRKPAARREEKERWERGRRIVFAQAAEVRTERVSVLDQKEKLEDLYRQFEKTNDKGHKNTPEYENMIHAFDRLRGHYARIAENLSQQGGVVTDKEQNHLWKLQQEALDGIENYMHKKGRFQISAAGRRRMELARNLKEQLILSGHHLGEDALADQAKAQTQRLQRLEQCKQGLEAFQKGHVEIYKENSSMRRAGMEAQESMKTLIADAALELFTAEQKQKLGLHLAKVISYQQLEVFSISDQKLEEKLQEYPQILEQMTAQLAGTGMFQNMVRAMTPENLGNLLSDQKGLKKLYDICKDNHLWNNKEKEVSNQQLEQPIKEQQQIQPPQKEEPMMLA